MRKCSGNNFEEWGFDAIFDIGNARLNRLVYETLSPQTGDHVLEIGSGTGKLLEKIACQVEGIDFSNIMVDCPTEK
jgi:ubiquinone/menaquinone biosynthesis C-methylase UbiE